MALRAVEGRPVWVSSNHFRASSPLTVGSEDWMGFALLIQFQFAGLTVTQFNVLAITLFFTSHA